MVAVLVKGYSLIQKLEEEIKLFFETYYEEDKGPLLLALSGGCDSLALFYLLLQMQKKYPFTLHIAHVNHNWREESTPEAQNLEVLALKYGCPFYTKKMEAIPKSNCEDLCRKFRQDFFKELVDQHHFQAILTGHQADEQAETILKRIFEGAGFHALGGIKKVREIQNSTYWSPLLSIYKKELAEYLSLINKEPFLDPTNFSTQYLRGRMRTVLLPFLEEHFGKNIQNNLLMLGQQSRDLSIYLQKSVTPILSSIQKQDGYWVVDLSSSKKMEVIEIQFLLDEIDRLYQLNLSKTSKKNLKELILQKKMDKQIQNKKAELRLRYPFLYVKKFCQ